MLSLHRWDHAAQAAGNSEVGRLDEKGVRACGLTDLSSVLPVAIFVHIFLISVDPVFKFLRVEVLCQICAVFGLLLIIPSC